MTLLIACLLIYNFSMPWWWYAVAGVLWAGHLAMQPVVTAWIASH